MFNPGEEEKIIHFEEDEVLADIVTESVTEFQGQEKKVKDDFDLYLLKEKQKRMKPVSPIDNKIILDSITALNATFGRFVTNQTVEIHAEAIEENIMIKKLTSIKSDTLQLNIKNFKLRVLEYLLFLFIGVCIGLLDNIWMPHLETAGVWLKTFIKVIW